MSSEFHNPQPSLRVLEYELDGGHNPVRLCRVYQRDGEWLWAIRRGCDTLNRNGEWEYEPQPSSRSVTYLKRNRYISTRDALRAWQKAVEAIA